jgi:nucleoside-diphosphate-sugar epimerase
MVDTIAITGATGFVGAAVARRLTTAGHGIRALIRPASTHKPPADLATQWVTGDLDDIQSLRRLVNGVHAVIHCAGAVRGATREQFNHVNANGLARLLQAAVNGQPKPRLLLISSLAAREPHLSHYAASKRQGERVLIEQSPQLPWTIYRPCAVYGPGDREILPVLKWMAKGVAPVLGSGNGRLSLIYVADLAEAVANWLDHDCCQSGIFELCDGQPGGYSWHDIIAAIKRLRRKTVVRLKIPVFGVKLVATLNLLAARCLGYAPMLTPGKVCELSHPDWVCDNGALNEATGWSPQILLSKGLQLTLGRCQRTEDRCQMTDI